MAALKVFLVAFLIIICLVPQSSCTDNDNEDEFIKNCKKQTTYFITGLQSLKVDFHYDAGGLQPDTFYIKSMCKARGLFKHVTFSFFVGMSVKRNEDGQLECPNYDEENKDCTYAYLDACASILVPDFAAYVCCNYADDKVTTVKECVEKQNANVDEFDTCAQLQVPNMKRDEILLKNSKDAYAAYSKEKCLPCLGFNGQSDKCARYTFYDDPVKVICAMLAEGVEEECKK